MKRIFNTDSGYITVREADNLVLRMIHVIDENKKSHYNKILKKAKQGEFGCKKYGKRMYHVRRDDIVKYADDCIKERRLQIGFDFEFNVDAVLKY